MKNNGELRWRSEIYQRYNSNIRNHRVIAECSSKYNIINHIILPLFVFRNRMREGIKIELRKTVIQA